MDQQPPDAPVLRKETNGVLAFYEQTREMIRTHGSFQWEGLKRTSSLYTALLAFHAAAVGAYLSYVRPILESQPSPPNAGLLGALLMAIPAAMLVFTVVGWCDLKRETKRLLEQIAGETGTQSLSEN